MCLSLLVRNACVAAMVLWQGLQDLSAEVRNDHGLLVTPQRIEQVVPDADGCVEVAPGEEVPHGFGGIFECMGFVLHPPHPVATGADAAGQMRGRVGEGGKTLSGPAVHQQGAIRKTVHQ